MTTSSSTRSQDDVPVLPALPSDEIRQIMWRLGDRDDLQQLIQAARGVARGLVARLVTDGQRDTYQWTPEKHRLLDALDQARCLVDLRRSGIRGEHRRAQEPGDGPGRLRTGVGRWWGRHMSRGLGARTAADHCLGDRAAEGQISPGLGPSADGKRVVRGAFCLTEPLPYAGVDTGVLSGKVRVEQWHDGEEPVLRVQKRGRFTNNMDFAQFVVAAVASDDPRIKGSCMVILEEGDPGTFDRGEVTHKLVHQLTSTRDPEFDLTVPASRIVGGYTIEDGMIVPNFSHAKVLDAVFSRTRVPAGVMTGAKLLSSVEPIIRYQRERFRGGEGQPGTPRHELGPADQGRCSPSAR